MSDPSLLHNNSNCIITCTSRNSWMVVNLKVVDWTNMTVIEATSWLGHLPKKMYCNNNKCRSIYQNHAFFLLCVYFCQVKEILGLQVVTLLDKLALVQPQQEYGILFFQPNYLDIQCSVEGLSCSSLLWLKDYQTHLTYTQ